MVIRPIECIMNRIIDKKRSNDIIEIFIKVQLNIKLNDQELLVYNSLDDVEKKLVYDLIKNPSFINDVEHIMDKLLNTENLMNGNKFSFEHAPTVLANILK